MAKQRLQRTRTIETKQTLLLTALVLGLGAVPGWAGQQSPNSRTRGTASSQASSSTPAKGSAERKSAKAGPVNASLGAGKRDPFKLPETAVAGKGGGPEGLLESAAPTGPLPQGVRGLLITQLRLEGVVREQASNKMIAVVTNETKRAYFLYENESVYNGVVSKITPDAVYFKENVLDPNGRVTTREVVRRLGSAPGEGR